MIIILVANVFALHHFPGQKFAFWQKFISFICICSVTSNGTHCLLDVVQRVAQPKMCERNLCAFSVVLGRQTQRNQNRHFRTRPRMDIFIAQLYPIRRWAMRLCDVCFECSSFRVAQNIYETWPIAVSVVSVCVCLVLVSRNGFFVNDDDNVVWCVHCAVPVVVPWYDGSMFNNLQFHSFEWHTSVFLFEWNVRIRCNSDTCGAMNNINTQTHAHVWVSVWMLKSQNLEQSGLALYNFAEKITLNCFVAVTCFCMSVYHEIQPESLVQK